LPASVEVCADSPGRGDEGTAMLEIVHDLAPGAKLAFCSARGSFFNAVLWSATKAFAGKGCDVIVDDTYNLTEPRLQLSDETTLMNAVRSELGKTVVTSAGNLADSNYRKPFFNADYSGTQPNAGLHDFGRSLGRASSIGFPVAVAPGGEAIVTLQWSEAYGKAASDFVMIPVLQSGAAIDSAGSPFTVPADISDNVQDGKGVPYEELVVTNTSATQQNFFVLIKRKTGNSFVDLSLVQIRSGESGFFTNFRTAEGSVIAHSGAEQALSVAAVNAADPGLNDIRPYSSLGPVITQFDNQGNRNFDLQFKPDITAVDGVSITGAGGFGGPEKNFSGTSASAPHVAGIAALLRSKVANVDVETSLLFSAQSRGSFLTWGAGLMDAERALEIAPYFVESSGPKRATASSKYGSGAATVNAVTTADTEAFARKALSAMREKAALDAANY
jgi:subtilisin family serine protease